MNDNIRYIGTTKELTECQHCGKTDLAMTVVLALLDEDGNETDVVYYGSTCASKALGLSYGRSQVIKRALAARRQTLELAAESRGFLEFYGLPETGEASEADLKAADAKRAEIYTSLDAAELRNATLRSLAACQKQIAEGVLVD